MEKIMLHIPVTVLLLLFIFFIHMTKYVNCSISVSIYTYVMCKPCVGAKVVIRFQALISHAFLDRSIPSICRKRILFISRFGAIVSHFVRGDIFVDSPCILISSIEVLPKCIASCSFSPGWGNSQYIVVGVSRGTYKKGVLAGVLGTGTTQKKGYLRHGHNPKNGGIRHGNKSKKGVLGTGTSRKKSGGGGVLRTGLVKKTILVIDVAQK